MPWLGYQLLGTVGSKPLSAEVPYLGPLETLDDVLRDTSAEELVAALDSDEFDAMAGIVNLTEKYGLKFSLIPYFATYMISRPYIDQVGSLPLVNLRRIPLDNMFNAFVKRSMDVAGSLLLILFTSPLMLAAALGTLTTLGRPIIFRQIRVGYQRKEFTMLKFRSMREPKPDDQSGWSSFDKGRITAFGSFLRKTSIDELPQLFNVLRGEMSLVGPRPELPKYVDKFRETVPLYMLKHQVRPGMTGLAQINGYRGDTSIEERIRLDLRYIETWSFLLDIKILFMTVFHFMDIGETKHHAEIKEDDCGNEEYGQPDDGDECPQAGAETVPESGGAGPEEPGAVEEGVPQSGQDGAPEDGNTDAGQADPAEDGIPQPEQEGCSEDGDTESEQAAGGKGDAEEAQS